MGKDQRNKKQFSWKDQRRTEQAKAKALRQFTKQQGRGKGHR